MGNAFYHKTQRVWYPEIDYMRSFAILGVIAIHTFGYFSHNQNTSIVTSFSAFIDALSIASVPLFICISGFVLTKNETYKRNYFDFLKGKFTRILFPYLLTSIVYFIYNSYINKSYPTIKQILNDLITGNAAYHLYFIPIIIELYLLYHLCYRLTCLLEKIHIFFPLVIALFMQYIWFFQDKVFSKLHWNLSFPFSSTLFLFLQLIFYYVLGIYIAINYDRYKNKLLNINNKLLIILSFSFAFIYSNEWMQGIKTYGSYYKIPEGYFLPLNILLPLINVLLFCLWYKLASYIINGNYNLDILKQISLYSFGIYLIHILVNDITVRILEKCGVTSERWTFYLILYFVTLIVSYYIIKFISKHNFTKNLLLVFSSTN